MTDRATAKQIRYILALNRMLGGGPARYANQLAVDLPMRLRTVDLHTATRRQASEIIERLRDAQEGAAVQDSWQPITDRAESQNALTRQTPIIPK